MKLSATMIVRNESENLPRCLESIKGLVDELIVVDTGSDDDTIKISKSFGAKVFEHPWEDDFSKARNQSFSHASHSWSMVLDADEELIKAEVNPKQFKDRLGKIDKEVAALAVMVEENHGDRLTSWPGARFFRMSANPQYEGCVHNNCSYDGMVAMTDIKIIHYGYHLSTEKMVAKKKRTMDLLEKRILTDPDDYNALYYMAQMAFNAKKYDDVIKYATRCFELLPRKKRQDPQFYATLYMWGADAYLKLDDGGNALAWIEKGLEYNPMDVDLNFLLTNLSLRCGYKNRTLSAGGTYLEAVKQVKSKAVTSKFANPLKMEDFISRTMYFLGVEHRKSVEKWMGYAT
jgi:glycosyltransferase involved in cell wall biosynthesis